MKRRPIELYEWELDLLIKAYVRELATASYGISTDSAERLAELVRANCDWLKLDQAERQAGGSIQ